MRKRFTIILILLLSIAFSSYSQHAGAHALSHEDHMPNFRVAVLIGHTLIPDEHAGKNFFIPSWALDLEYWINKTWGIGLHSDLELETYIILRSDGEQEDLERQSPLVVTLDALYKPWKGLVFQLGPGIEFERSENLPLLRAGIEYEFTFKNHWDIAPTLFYDARFGEYHTWSIALGVGKRF